jgi:hypothetical protein
MAAAKERLDQLLKLAAERRWPVLARELTDLALAWPQEYPGAMQVPVLALLQAALRQSDEATRTELAARMGGHPELPLRLLNLVYLVAPSPLRREILMRNELEADGEDEAPADAAGLLAAARNGTRDFASALERSAAIPRPTAEAILQDASGEALAVLCRGAGLDRAIFSAVALLRTQNVPLSVFDSVPQHAAERLVHDWRAHREASVTEHIRAAE